MEHGQIGHCNAPRVAGFGANNVVSFAIGPRVDRCVSRLCGLLCVVLVGVAVSAVACICHAAG